MSKKEEALRRAVLSRDSTSQRSITKHDAMRAFAVASVLAMGADPRREPRIDLDAERGRFSSGELHPHKCSCAKCATWIKAEKAKLAATMRIYR